jgi:hypothetical protein
MYVIFTLDYLRRYVWGAEIRFMLRGCTRESVHRGDLGA